jgi:hypothetical protein
VLQPPSFLWETDRGFVADQSTPPSFGTKFGAVNFVLKEPNSNFSVQLR